MFKPFFRPAMNLVMPVTDWLTPCGTLSMGIVAHEFAAALRSRRQTRSVPSAAEGLNQQHCVRHSTAQNINRSDLIRKRRTLSSDHLEVTCDPTLVANDGKVQGALCRRHRFILDLRFVFQNSNGCQIVFHLLESIQHILSIGSDLIVISGTCLIVKSMSSSGIEHGFNRGEANRP